MTITLSFELISVVLMIAAFLCLMTIPYNETPITTTGVALIFVVFAIGANIIDNIPAKTEVVEITNIEYRGKTIADTKYGKINLGNERRFEKWDEITLIQEQDGEWRLAD